MVKKCITKHITQKVFLYGTCNVIHDTVNEHIYVVLIEKLCMHVHFSPIIKYIYNVFEFDSPWQFYFCHTVIFWVGPAQMISFWVNFIKNVVLLCFMIILCIVCTYGDFPLNLPTSSTVMESCVMTLNGGSFLL